MTAPAEALSVLDLGTAVVKALVVSPALEVLGVGAAEREPGAEGEVLVAAVERALVMAENAAGQVPRRVAVGIAAVDCVIAAAARDARHAYAAEHGVSPPLTALRERIFVPASALARVRSLVETLDLDLASHVPEPVALGALAGGEGAVVVDVGAAATSVTVLSRGQDGSESVAPQGTLVAPLGGESLAARIVERLGVTRAQALDAVVAHGAGAARRSSAGPGTGRVVAELATHHADVWRDALETALAELAKGGRLPARVLLCGGGAQLPDLSRALEAGGWHVALPFEAPPRVEVALPGDVAGVRPPVGTALGPEWVVPLSLGAAAATAGAERAR